jgi:hypothetical protein
VAFALPQHEHGANWILYDRHAADVHHIERLSDHCAAEFCNSPCGVIGVVGGDVKHPVWVNSLRLLILTQCVSCGSVLAIKFEHGIELAGAHGRVVDAPAEQVLVELLRGLLIGGPEFHPAE